jgi:hypothetical protein
VVVVKADGAQAVDDEVSSAEQAGVDVDVEEQLFHAVLLFCYAEKGSGL